MHFPFRGYNRMQYKQLNLKTNLTIVIVMSCVITLILATSIFTFLNVRHANAEFKKQINTTAELLANKNAVAIALGLA